ncbi:MAG TPA: hypothetical protein VF665_22930 [Longimicrobium sp.]|uniref:hypothetical protein n=1 Tax=Longimicrobium sp. TaxID=2029185 RepID=UPI002EDB9FED
MRWNALSLLGAAVLCAACQDGSDDLVGPPSSPTRNTIPAACAGIAYTRPVYVADAAQLAGALASAQAGDLIVLADGVYRRYAFDITVPGTASSPITLCGSRNAVLRSTSLGAGGMIRLKTSYWRLRGFSVDSSQIGIHVTGGRQNVLDSLSVTRTGLAGIKIHQFSRSNIVRNNYIDDTGLVTPEYGEGIYLGTDSAAWGGQADTSDSTQVLNNRFGPRVRSENVDVKEGTTGGTIAGNQFNGQGMIAAASALPHWVDSWVDVKGNGYVIRDNRGEYTLEFGIDVYSKVAGWGRNNQLLNNTFDLRGANGYGFHILAQPNLVSCSNTVVNAGKGFANVTCTP